MMLEEKIEKYIKIAFLFLIMLLGVSLTSIEAGILFLLFHIAFIKE